MSHGGDRYRNKIKYDFSVNLNPEGVSEGIKRSIAKSLERLEHYPDPENEELIRALCETTGLKKESIVFGNGASELITALMNALRPKKVFLPVPSFKGYERALKAAGAGTVEIKMNEEFDITGEALDIIDGTCDILFLTNPNNPTGKYIKKDILDELIRRALKNNVKVVLDECFMELSDAPEEHTYINKTEEFPNLVILRAFTKSFAIPGVRLGYLICSDEKLIEKIKDNLPEWNISVMASAAGTVALKEVGSLRNTAALIKEERAFLEKELRLQGFEIVASDTVFLLIRNKALKCDLYDELLKREILIRDCSDYKNMEPGYYRIAVKKHEENIVLINNIKEMIDHEKY